ncbi:MAG: RNA polymerase sigma factor [Christensenellales bacterium]|jgi:RNA polymerase sigma-70 factor (ECF subfamily)
MLENHLRRLGQGDISALADVYKIMRKAVFSVCYTMMRDYSLAEDMMQDTFLRVNHYIKHYKEREKAKAWILRIAKNVCLNELKKRKREVFSEYSIDRYNKGTTEITAYDESGIISAVNKYLNENESRIVLMHTIGDISLKDIAELLQKPQGTVRWQYNNALNKLRKMIKKEELL